MDVAVVEGLIEGDETIARYSHEGVPDLRLIVFRGIPLQTHLHSVITFDGLCCETSTSRLTVRSSDTRIWRVRSWITDQI